MSTILKASGIVPRVSHLFAPLLRQACERFAIHTPLRLAAFVSQCACETRGFTTLEQGLLFRTPERIHAMWPERVPDVDEAELLVAAPEVLANTVYAGRHGNGDAASGDGWRYRGRGLLRLLGRAAYRDAGAALDRPYEAQPELVAHPREACLVAAWLWQQRGLNELADRLQFEAIARRVREPRSPLLQERRSLYRGALAILQDLGHRAHRGGAKARPAARRGGAPSARPGPAAVLLAP
ncbi:glycoside hydrolase family 19 protein [Azohydromonas caseinilytica]|uniref:Glycoside hydrolase family 19 protein n=1 Tax=Azohydromonas caseinilytica TaxID=2728836 RepID=A0A848FF36_9BURK|nr:glycoside hydrolase family 19 protein [Azohydromonas caseinilytica]NML18028.1 glycoside hydrolase family 19 protein [Azohydromonas caseinilytica]